MNHKEKIPTVIIFGRANTGKSTLFNRLIEEKRALISNQAGTTRDANSGIVGWQGAKFETIDTGGILDLKEFTSDEKIRIAPDKQTIDKKVQLQAGKLLSRADLILFLVDIKAGLLPQDRQLALYLKERAGNKKIIVAANKTDSPKENFRLPEFYKLGLGEPFPISAATGSGTGDLLDEIVLRLKIKTGRGKDGAESENGAGETGGEDEKATGPEEPSPVRAAILGKPNVGKSSLVNSLFGDERVIVSPVAHTTREPQDTELFHSGRRITLIDTAGISRKASLHKRAFAPSRAKAKVDLEKEGIGLSLKSLNRAEVALLVIDISADITREDLRLADEIIGRKKSLIIIANKWDLIKEKDVKKFTEYINYRLPFAVWAPIIYVSALTGRKTGDILQLISDIKTEREKIIPVKELDKFLKRIVKIHRPARSRASTGYPFIKKIRQTRSDPPEMEVLIGANESLDSSYLRFIENQFRDQFKFIGTPIAVRVKKGTFGKK